MLHVVKNLGRAQQRLGRDATPVQENADQIIARHDRGLKAELRCTDRRHVAARTRANDHHVEGGVSHVVLWVLKGGGAATRYRMCRRAGEWLVGSAAMLTSDTAISRHSAPQITSRITSRITS